MIFAFAMIQYPYQKGRLLADAEAQKKSEGVFGETIKIVVQALLLALVVRTLLFQPFSIPSGSMKPTLLIGDYLFVSKMSYGFSKYSIPFSPDFFDGRIWGTQPKRGDVAVFRTPSNPDVDYVKRVIGLPGDRIQMKGGILHINSVPVKKELTGETIYKPQQSSTGFKVPVFTETLPNGVSYKTLDLDPDSSTDNTQVFEVPPGHYFMMGDNRDNSSDSRLSVGFVPFENFIGRAKIIFFSVSSGSAWQFWRWPSTMRAGRLFTGL